MEDLKISAVCTQIEMYPYGGKDYVLVEFTTDIFGGPINSSKILMTIEDSRRYLVGNKYDITIK